MEYLRLDTMTLSSKVSVAEKDVQDFLSQPTNKQKVKEYFDLHKNEFNKDPQIKARHILIKAAKGDKKAEDAAKLKISEIQAEVKSHDFATLAKKYSDDPGSKEKGGDLGWFGRGRMVPEFEKAAFDLAEGQVSAPVQSPFGFHIIKLERRQAAQSTTFEKAQFDIGRKMVASKKAADILGHIEMKMVQDPQGAAKELLAANKDLKWEETGTFSLFDDQIPKIGDNGDLMAEIADLKNENSYLPHIFKSGEMGYLIKTKPPKKDSKEDAKNKSDSTKDLSRSVYIAWSSKLRETAKIKINQQLFGDSNQSAGDDNYPGY